MNRRLFLGIAAASLAPAAPGSGALLLLTDEEARRIRDRVLKGDPALAAAVRKHAASALKAGPWSVTTQRPPGIDAKPNDYYSEGPYWWPDPKNPSGPYIRKDGERYPARFEANRRALGDLCEAVLALGMGTYFLGDAGCAAHAAKILSVWFVDAKTRMNPHLEYGQAIKGHNTGRGAGQIDTVSLIYAVQGIQLLRASGKLDSALETALRAWFSDYLRWMTTSRKGLDEKKAGNNHATWWTAQAAAYAGFAGDGAARKMLWEHYRTHLVPTQIRPDGSCPAEEARTNSLSYSTMNLNGYSVLCRMAQMEGVDLWRFRAPNGVSVESCFRYLLPYVLKPETWRKQQISKFSPGGTIFPGLAGLGLNSTELLRGFAAIEHSDSPLVSLVDLIVRAQAV